MNPWRPVYSLKFVQSEGTVLSEKERFPFRIRVVSVVPVCFYNKRLLFLKPENQKATIESSAENEPKEKHQQQLEYFLE